MDSSGRAGDNRHIGRRSILLFVVALLLPGAAFSRQVARAVDPPPGYTASLVYHAGDQKQLDVTTRVDSSAAPICGEYFKIAETAFGAGIRFAGVTGATITAPADPARLGQVSDLFLGGPNIQAGQTGLVTIAFTGNYPVDAGAVVGIFGCDGKEIGKLFDVAGPAAPVPPKPCKCVRLTARILPASLSLRQVGGQGGATDIHLAFRIHWTLTCLQGGLGCLADLEPVAPKGRTYHTSFLFSNGEERQHLVITCKGVCGETKEGSAALTLRGRNLEAHDRKAVGHLSIVIGRACGGKKLTPITLSIAFNQSGNIDVAKSKLG